MRPASLLAMRKTVKAAYYDMTRTNQSWGRRVPQFESDFQTPSGRAGLRGQRIVVCLMRSPGYIGLRCFLRKLRLWLSETRCGFPEDPRFVAPER